MPFLRSRPNFSRLQFFFFYQQSISLPIYFLTLNLMITKMNIIISPLLLPSNTNVNISQIKKLILGIKINLKLNLKK